MGQWVAWLMFGCSALTHQHEPVDRSGFGLVGWSLATRVARVQMLVLGGCLQEAARQTDTLPAARDREALRRKVEALAAKLDADKADDRDEAERQLLELGPDAIAHLPPVQEDASSEWLIRIERVRETLLSRNQLEFGQPSHVTLSGEMTGREALTRLAAKTGNSLALPELTELEKQIVVAFDGTSYWEAFDAILDQLELTIEPEDGGSLQWTRRSPEVPQRSARATYAEGFRMEPIAVVESSDFYESPVQTASITISLAWESRWVPVSARFLLRDLEVVCDNGERLMPIDKEPLEFSPSGSQMVFTLELSKPSRAAKEITTWKGSMEILIPGKPVAMEFSELDQAANKKISIGDLSVVLVKARKNRDLHEVLVDVSVQNEVDSETPWGWIALTDGYLVDKGGKRIEHAGWSTTHVNARTIGLSYLFELENDLSEYRLVYRSPQTVELRVIPYSLENIPLP